MMVGENGAQALKAAAPKTPPDLILLGIMMPDPAPAINGLWFG
jgi:CheY-like chemotaxis protein